MVIISNKPGQLGNLLFIYAHFLAFGHEKKLKVLNPSFYAYRSYFERTDKQVLTGNVVFYKACYFLSRLLLKLNVHNSVLNVVALDWHETADLQKTPALGSKFCFVQGWLFRSEPLLKKNSDYIRTFFMPKAALQKELDNFFDTHFSRGNDLVIGIHMRRGDYKTFENGKYYYSVAQYAALIKKLARIFAGKNPRFLIASNETIDLSNSGLEDLSIRFAPGHELLDLYSLARCSYIAGPPSTYSMWASFYGKVPLLSLKAPDMEFTISDFKIYPE